MQKNDDTFQRRAEYVKKRVASAPHAEREIKRLAKELFLSESTIYKDLKRVFPSKDGNSNCKNSY